MTQIALTSGDQLQNGAVDSGPSRVERLTRRVGRPLAAAKDLPHAGTYAGVLLAAVGAVLIALAWGRTAGLTSVARQVPFVLSAGFTGLGLVVVGVTVVSISAKQADARERTRQTAELRALLGELRRAVQGDEQAGDR